MGQQKNRGIIGILTGGGDVPGLNPAIRAVTIRALREGYKVIGSYEIHNMTTLVIFLN